MGTNSTHDDRTTARKEPAPAGPEKIRPERVRPENVPADEVARASSAPPPVEPLPVEPPAPDLLRLQLSSARLAEVGILAIRGPVERAHRYVLREVFD